MLKKALSRIRKEKPTGTPWMKCYYEAGDLFK